MWARIARHTNSILLPFLSVLLLSSSLSWVGFGFLAWIAIVPLILFVADTRVGRVKLYVVTIIALFLHMLAVAHPLMHIAGAWWAGTHELNRILSESIQYTIGMVVAAVWRTLFFVPLIPLIRASFEKRWGSIIIAMAWTFIEWAYATFGLWGYSAGVLGYALVDTPYLSHAATLGSVYLLSFVIVFFNVELAALVLRTKGGIRAIIRERVFLPPFVLAMAILVVCGYTVTGEPDSFAKLRVAVIGTALSTDGSVTEAGYRSYREKLIVALDAAPDLVLFPENALPYFELREEDGSLIENTLVNFPDRDALYQDFLALSRAHASTTIAIGMHTTRAKKHYNSLVFIKNGLPIAYYEKRILVPFSEYAPFGLKIPLAVRFAQGDMHQPIVVQGVAIDELICSEIADTNIPAEGALLLAPSNDSIFEGDAGARMHLAMARMRAIERDTPLLRADKGGTSDIIDKNGRVLAETREGVIFATLSLR